MRGIIPIFGPKNGQTSALPELSLPGISSPSPHLIRGSIAGGAVTVSLRDLTMPDCISSSMSSSTTGTSTGAGVISAPSSDA